jgi:shikimate dehydrogenase
MSEELTPHSALRTPHSVGLIGWPVAHSLSPVMQDAAFAACGLAWRYELWPVPAEALAITVAGLRRGVIAGANVTVPHKTAVLPLLDELSAAAQRLGAVNTIVHADGRLIGHNTDVTGFWAALEAAGELPSGSHAVILGAGGAARAVYWALHEHAIPTTVLARNVGAAAALLTLTDNGDGQAGTLDSITLRLALEGATLLVNTTSAGMWPHADESPLPPGVTLPPDLLVYDLVYRPRRTRLLAQAAAAGCRTLDGLGMLLHQGAASFELWTGQRAPLAVMRAALEAALASEMG